jgi:hypothetical protein
MRKVATRCSSRRRPHTVMSAPANTSGLGEQFRKCTGLLSEWMLTCLCVERFSPKLKEFNKYVGKNLFEKTPFAG